MRERKEIEKLGKKSLKRHFFPLMFTISLLERHGLADILISSINTLQNLIKIVCYKSVFVVILLASSLEKGELAG